MSLWLCNVSLGGCVRERKAKTGELGPRLTVTGGEESLVLLAGNDGMVQRWQGVRDETAESECWKE